MKNSYYASRRFHFRWAGRLCFFLLLLTVACQPAQPTLKPTQPSPTNIPEIEQTPTNLVAIASPENIGAPTTTSQSSVTDIPSTLSMEYPWLIYKNYSANNEFFILNQDGTERATIDLPSCDFYAGVDIQENPLNHTIFLEGNVYLVEPSQGKWSLLYGKWPPCHTAFTGNEQKGFLANIIQIDSNAIPELFIYELPSGRILDQFPLMKCSDTNIQCNMDDLSWWRIEWSPNGRYLAFPAVLDGPSSDLYVYDTKDGSIRQLTNGPDNVGPILWSPDGSQIIMGEFAEHDSFSITSFWTVSVSQNDIRLLNSLDHPFPQGFIGWMDDRRFIVYEGTSLYNALDLPAHNIRLVDKDSGEVKTLFSESFVAVEIDKTNETLAVYAYDDEPVDGYEGQGIYLLSVSEPKLRFVGRGQLQPDWNDDLGLFVTNEVCDDDPSGKLAFNYKGEFQCIHPSSPDNLASPDGQKQIIIDGGTWLTMGDQQPVKISEGGATQLIWRQDSAGLFFVVDQTLYYASFPGLNISIVDENVGSDQILYEWLSSNTK